MPNCFRLHRKLAQGGQEAEATSLLDIDEEICKFFGVEVDPDWWYYSWYDVIGWDLAMGRSFQQIREIYSREINKEAYAHMLEILSFIEERFVPYSWVEIGNPR